MENKKLNNYNDFEYVNEVREYVNGLLKASLLAENPYDAERQQANTELLSKIYENPELGKQICEEIVAHGIKYSSVAYNPYSPDEIRRTVFMRYLSALLNEPQIATLAVYFDKKIEAQKTQENFQGRSR